MIHGIFINTSLIVMQGYGHGMNFGMGWGLGWIFPLIILGLLVWLVVKVSRQNQSAEAGQITSESPLDILKKRYARGEIDKQEFEEKKKDLM